MAFFGFGKKSEDRESIPSGGPAAEPMRSVVDFDLLVRQTQTAQDSASLDQLWSAVYSLPKWYMIARGEFPNIRPFIGVVGEKPFLHAFTDAERAHRFAAEQELVRSDGSAMLLDSPMPGFIETVPSYQKIGVYGILFNSGPFGFHARLEDLKPMRDYFRSKNSPGPSHGG
jgi:hypothetical protein